MAHIERKIMIMYIVYLEDEQPPPPPRRTLYILRKPLQQIQCTTGLGENRSTGLMRSLRSTKRLASDSVNPDFYLPKVPFEYSTFFKRKKTNCCSTFSNKGCLCLKVCTTP